MSNLSCIVYVIRNIISGTLYVGIAINAKYRKNSHWTGINSNPKLTNAMKSYGKDKFIFDVILQCNSIKDACLEESALLSTFKITGQKVYNITNGGEHPLLNSWTPNEMEKEIIFKMNKNGAWLTKVSKTLNINHKILKKWAINESLEFANGKKAAAPRGANHYLFGKHPSEETKAKMSKSHKGKRLGKKFSEEHIQNMRKVRIGKKASEEAKLKMSQSRLGNKNHFFGKKHTNESKKKMSESSKGKIPVHKITDPDLISKIIKLYNDCKNIRKVAKQIKLSHTTIIRILHENGIKKSNQKKYAHIPFLSQEIEKIT